MLKQLLNCDGCRVSHEREGERVIIITCDEHRATYWDEYNDVHADSDEQDDEQEVDSDDEDDS